MANENDTLFNVDAGLILAKLHLAGCLTYKKDPQGNDIHFLNSGFPADSNGLTPEAPGDVKFDLKNIDGTYEVACAMLGLIVYKWLTMKLGEQILKNAHDILTSGDDDSSAVDDEKKVEEEIQKKMEPLKEAVLSIVEGESKEYLEMIKKYPGNIADMRKFAFTYLAQKDGYMFTFCGKDNAAKIKEDEMVTFAIPKKFDYKYDKYSIPSSNNDLDDEIADIHDEKMERLFNEIDKLKDKNNFDEYSKFIISLANDQKAIDEYFQVVLDDKSENMIAFKIGYSVEVATM